MPRLWEPKKQTPVRQAESWKERLEKNRVRRRELMDEDKDFEQLSLHWMLESFRHRYGYNFNWLGVPILKYPQDLMALQELFFRVRPDVVIETGVAYGGSMLYSASLLESLGGEGIAIGIERGVLKSTREAVATSNLRQRLRLIEGDSVSAKTLAQVRALIKPGARVLVLLDSDHSHAHVLRELEAYGPMVSEDSYVVVFDTFIEHLDGPVEGRGFGPGNSPKTAVDSFLATHSEFEVDDEIQSKIMISEAMGGYLRRVRGTA